MVDTCYIIKTVYAMQLVKQGKAQDNGNTVDNNRLYGVITRYDNQTTCHYLVKSQKRIASHIATTGNMIIGSR